MNHLVAPSLLAANFGRLEDDIEMVNKSDADWFHLDIMDGVFVPNISFGFPVMKYIREKADKPLDAHLMIVDPDRYIDRFKEAGVDLLTIHYEACTHLHRTLQKIKSTGMKAGVALNPHTPVSLLEEIIGMADLVLVMSVNPGFGAQKFIETSYNKIAKVRTIIDSSGSKALIEVDGGVEPGNAKALVEAGVDVLVAGNSVFGADNPSETIMALKNA